MSGPIIRQYGIPNWDDIFGKKDEQPTNSQNQPVAEKDAEKEQSSDPPEAVKDPKNNE